MRGPATLRVLLALGACVALCPSPIRVSDAFALSPARGNTRELQFVGRAAGRPEDLEQFTLPEKRVPGHAVLAVFRALGLMTTIFSLSVWVVPAILAGLPAVKRKDPLRRKYVDRVISVWSQMTTWPFFKVQVKGRENLLHEDQAVVYCANHQSFMDILSCYHLSMPFKWVSKASILKIPVIGWAMKRASTITVERDDRRSQVATFRQCIASLKEGVSIFIFPEGTRSFDGALLEFKKGPFSMAKKANVPIVPVTIRGTGRLMPSKKEFFLFRNGPGVEVVVHPPVSAQEVQDTPDAELLLNVRQTIESALPARLQKGTVAT